MTLRSSFTFHSGYQPKIEAKSHDDKRISQIALMRETSDKTSLTKRSETAHMALWQIASDCFSSSRKIATYQKTE